MYHLIGVATLSGGKCLHLQLSGKGNRFFAPLSISPKAVSLALNDKLSTTFFFFGYRNNEWLAIIISPPHGRR